MNTILVANIFFFIRGNNPWLDADPAKLSFHSATADSIRRITSFPGCLFTSNN
jgi:hypothetical protein